MPMEPALLEMLTQTMFIAARTGMDNSGDYTYDTPTTIACRVENAQRIVRPQPGEELVTQHLIFTAVAITNEHKVWLPGAVPASDPGLRPSLVEIILNDFATIDHYETHV